MPSWKSNRDLYLVLLRQLLETVNQSFIQIEHYCDFIYNKEVRTFIFGMLRQVYWLVFSEICRVVVIYQELEEVDGVEEMVSHR